MRYVSTRGETTSLSFTEAVLTGLAPDGGLLVPDSIPQIGAKLSDWQALSFTELATEIIALFVDDIPADDLRAIVNETYSHFDHEEIVPFTRVGDIEVLELFHGPTLAFKDIALQLLGQLFEYILAARGQHLNILGATSGDTGSAAIAGVRGLADIDIFVMYPHGRISPLQELQMTTVLDPNVHCLSVSGSFDDCQKLMKTIFGDLEFKERYSLGAVNSVNWARVLAQIVYYGYASLRKGGDGPVTFCVPTGNFGNVFAGYLAKRMGFPIEKLIVATNENDILSVFFATGRYERGDVRFTVTPAMDIQVASNFERFLYYHMGSDAERLKRFMAEFAESGKVSIAAPGSEDFAATAVSVAETVEAIRSTYQTCGYVADPHTAVGLAAAGRFETQGTRICLATAHPAKFPETVNAAVGADVARHPALQALQGRESRTTQLPASVAAIKSFIVQHAR